MLKPCPLVLGLLAAALLTGCGSEDPGLIPADRARPLTETVDAVKAACEGKDPDTARDALAEARNQVTELPGSVDRALRRNLRDWLTRIANRIEQDCKPEEEETPTPTASPTATPTETPEETPTPDETVSPEPTETASPEPTVEPPGDGGVPAPEGDDG